MISDEAQQRLLQERRFFESLSEKLGFLHIPKTGGTAIEVWGKSHGVFWGKHDTSLEGEKRKTGCNAWHTPQRLKNKDSFCVVRRPFDRLVSEYKHRACAKHASTVCDLDHFNTWVRDLLKGDLRVNDCHVLPQKDYMPFCDHVLNFDALQADFSALLERVTDDDNHKALFLDTNNDLSRLDVVPQPRIKITADCDKGCDFTFDDLEPENQQAFLNTYQADADTWNRINNDTLRGAQKT